MNAIYKFVLGMIGKRSGVITTLPTQKQIEFQVNMLSEKIMRNGINPNDLKTVGQVENVVNQIDQPRVIPADSAEGKAITEKILGRKKADVFDLEGNRIPDGSGIMGGKKVESDAAIKARLDANNQKGIGNLETNNFALNTITKIKSLSPMDAMKEANLVAGKKGRYLNLNDKQVKKIIDDTNDHIFERDIPEEDFATGGRAGFKGGFGKGFLEFMKKFKVKQSGDGVNEFLSKRKFLQSMVGETEKNKKARQLAELKEAAEKARKEGGFQFKNIDVDKDIRPILDRGLAEALKKDRKLNSDGGRIGLKNGMTKRAFMKLMGGFGATVGAAKSGIFTGFGKGATKQVAKEVAQQTTSSMPPPYFFKLAEKIKKMGYDVTPTTDRTVSKALPSKDGKSEYILEESLTSGDTLIKKVYKEEDMITNVEIMSLKKGEDVVTKKGKPVKTPDEYEEVTETNSRVYKDNFNDPDYEDGINVDEIIKEVDDTTPSIKYASGGLAYMLGE